MDRHTSRYQSEIRRGWRGVWLGLLAVFLLAPFASEVPIVGTGLVYIFGAFGFLSVILGAWWVGRTKTKSACRACWEHLAVTLIPDDTPLCAKHAEQRWRIYQWEQHLGLTDDPA